MEKKLLISISYSGSADRAAVSGQSLYDFVRLAAEDNGGSVMGNSAAELNAADGLVCIIADNDYEEVRKSLTYALDREKPVAYFLEDDITLDDGMRLQLGLAADLGKLRDGTEKLQKWLEDLKNRKKKNNGKKKVLVPLIGSLVLVLILMAVLLKPDGNKAPEKGAAETGPAENTEEMGPYAVDPEEIMSLQSLDLSGKGLTDISFLQNAVDLEELDISDNAITDISALSKLSKLKKLDISNNEVKDINILLALPELREADIRSNPIEDYTVLEYMKGVDVRK